MIVETNQACFCKPFTELLCSLYRSLKFCVTMNDEGQGEVGGEGVRWEERQDEVGGEAG